LTADEIEQLLSSDKEFDKLYQKQFQNISTTHWSPLEKIKVALEWLDAKSGDKILDIGSGVGKFCTAGALSYKGNFTGVEIRKNIFNEARKVKTKLGLENLHFIHSDILEIDFKDFNHFYYFNPFNEQITETGWIDKKLEFSDYQFKEYERYVFNQLELMPGGTKIVTYHSANFNVPPSYQLANLMFNGTLELWVKG
jgi:predicted RNA methylase